MDFAAYRSLQQETVIDDLKVSYVVQGEGMPLVGYGYSDQRDRFDRSIKVQARMLSRLLEQLNVQDVFVAGHVIGGAVAQRFVVDHADRVPKWVLIDSVLYDSWPADPMVRLGNPKQHYTTRGDELAKKFIERLPDGFHHRDRATPEMLQGWMKPYMTDEGKLSLIRNASALNTNHTMELIDDLKRLTQPVMLLWGAKDQFQPLASAERFKAEFPAADLRVVPDSDHFMPFEKPDDVARNLIEFLG